MDLLYYSLECEPIRFSIQIHILAIRVIRGQFWIGSCFRHAFAFRKKFKKSLERC
jgi:hypothetical protein